MLFGTYKQDEEYLWNKFRKPVFDPATGLDQETASKELLSFAEMKEPVPVIKAKSFEFLAKNLQIEVDPHDFFPAFACWKRVPRVMGALLGKFRGRISLQKEDLWGLLNSSGASCIWIDFDHSVPEWDEVFERGFPGLLRNAMQWREKHRADGTLDERMDAYFEGIRITYEAILLISDVCIICTCKILPDVCKALTY